MRAYLESLPVYSCCSLFLLVSSSCIFVGLFISTLFLVIFNSICTPHLQTYWRNKFRGFMFAPARFLRTTATWEHLNRILGIELWSRDAAPSKGLSAFGLDYSVSGCLSSKERFSRISPCKSCIPASVLSDTLGCRTSFSQPIFL